MPRKRMLSPEIWEDEGFGALDLLGKVVFIGLISQADDEGRGILSSRLLKSNIFPYDDKLRIADLDNALQEIGQKTSTVIYEVNGKSYYSLSSWSKWQSINKPTASKFPPPPCGVRGDTPTTGALREDYGSTTVVLPEDYRLKEEKGIEEKGIEGKKVSKKEKKEVDNTTHARARAWDEVLDIFQVSASVHDALIEFIRHLLANGVTMVNSRLENIITKLDLTYRNDEAAKVAEIEEAIACGYKRLPCEGGKRNGSITII